MEVDLLSDAIGEVQNHATTTYEAMSQFATELPKEAKSSTSLNPIVAKLLPKIKEYLKIMEGSAAVLAECDQSGKDFTKDLDTLTRLLRK
jgi:hypothetical protein